VSEPLLESRGIVKSFGGVRALRGADFAVHPGEVAALVGDNGAGKSTLVKILSGTLAPDGGEIWFEGHRVTVPTPVAARELGIETVYQDLALAPDLVGIFGTNLFSAEGAATGLRSAGSAAKVKIVGFDAGPKQVEDLKQGIVQALIAQKPADIGKAGVEQAIAALKGEPVEKKIGTGFVVVTKDNMNDSDVQPFLYKSSC
jgi:ABC-type sugar transport system substrate-binding protein